MGNKKDTCNICPFLCRISLGEYGLCKVRKRERDGIIDTTRGRLTYVAVEPVRKKPFFHLGEDIIRTLSIGSTGCSLSCQYCENHFYSQNIRLYKTQEYSPKAIVDIALGNSCHAVCFSFTEPLIHYEYLLDIAEECHKYNLRFLIKTNGYINSEPWNNLLFHIDAVNIDYKGNNYPVICCGDNNKVKDRILEALVFHKEVHTEISIPLYKGIDVEDLKQFSEMVATLDDNVPIHLLKVYPSYQMLIDNMISDEKIAEIKNIFLFKLKHVYVHTNE
jgi:pyruvate formate lyase activating enzyme